jgi:hypothetical protein
MGWPQAPREHCPAVAASLRSASARTGVSIAERAWQGRYLGGNGRGVMGFVINPKASNDIVWGCKGIIRE